MDEARLSEALWNQADEALRWREREKELSFIQHKSLQIERMLLILFTWFQISVAHIISDDFPQNLEGVELFMLDECNNYLSPSKVSVP